MRKLVLLLKEGEKPPPILSLSKFFASRFPAECFNSFSILSLPAAGSGFDSVSSWVVIWEDPGSIYGVESSLGSQAAFSDSCALTCLLLVPYNACMSSSTSSRTAASNSKNILAQIRQSESAIQPWMGSVTALVIIAY